ncbi:MAG: transposase [Planctomyces sp.]|nr:transposase [Planctomyces sp.]
MLPHELAPQSTVYDHFAAWRDDGTWQSILNRLRRRCPACPQASGTAECRAKKPRPTENGAVPLRCDLRPRNAGWNQPLPRVKQPVAEAVAPP